MTHPLIVAAKRTAVSPKGGTLSKLSLEELAAPVLQQVLLDAGLTGEMVDEVIVSNALGAGGNPARLITLHAGFPQHVAGITIDRQCVGGLDAIGLAATLIRSGAVSCVIAGGVESYSQRPERRYLQPDGTYRFSDRPRFAPKAALDPDLASAAAELADTRQIAQSEQDAFACESHAKAMASEFGQEIVSVDFTAQRDSFARHMSPALCARAPRIEGSITYANSAVAADAAAFCLIVSPQFARQHGLAGTEIVDHITLGSDPRQPALSPVYAIRKVLDRNALQPADLQKIELMEAYAVQAIVCARDCDLPIDRLNQKGGALARGHPIGASGAILAVRLFHDLDQGHGLASIAAAGGLGTAMLLRR